MLSPNESSETFSSSINDVSETVLTTEFINPEDQNSPNIELTNNKGLDSPDRIAFLEYPKVKTIPITMIPTSLELDEENIILASNKWKFNVGLIGSVGSSWIMNNEFRASLSKESSMSTKLGLARSYGISGEAILNGTNYFGVNVYFNSTLESKLGYFDNGLYQYKESNISFFEIAALYGRKFNLLERKEMLAYCCGQGLSLGLIGTVQLLTEMCTLH